MSTDGMSTRSELVEGFIQEVMSHADNEGLRFENRDRVVDSIRHALVFMYDDMCEESVLNLLRQIEVGFDREMRYRLEKEFFHSVTGYAIRRLEGRGRVKRTALPGRRLPPRSVFYRLSETDYRQVLDIIKEKRALSIFVDFFAREAGFFAQRLWENAFEDSGFEILAREVKAFDGRRATIPGDIDFVARKDGISYGVEVKNSLSYPTDLAMKFRIAVDLGIIPFFVVRWISKAQFYTIMKYGGLVKIYETSIYSPLYKDRIDRCRKVLGYPVIAVEKISEKSRGHLDKIHEIASVKIDDLRKKNSIYLERPAFF